jgi:hypothetical protein
VSWVIQTTNTLAYFDTSLVTKSTKFKVEKEAPDNHYEHSTIILSKPGTYTKRAHYVYTL